MTRSAEARAAGLARRDIGTRCFIARFSSVLGDDIALVP
jgi:hypothetical protein